MDNINGSGRRGGDFQPREITHGSSPKSQKSQGVAVHGNLLKQNPRHITPSFPDRQSVLRRAVYSTYGQSYLKGGVRGGMLRDIEWALKNKQSITVNDDASLGNRRLAGACKQFEKILQELNNEHLREVDDLSFLGESFTEKFNRINQGAPEEVAKIVVELSNSLEKWHRNTDVQNVKITGARVQQIDKECKAILKMFLVAQPKDDGDSGIDSRSGSDTESIPESINEPEWKDEDFIATGNSRTIVKPPQPAIMQGPKHPPLDLFNSELDDDSVIEPRQDSPQPPGQYNRSLTHEPVTIPAEDYTPVPTSMTVEQGDLKVEPESNSPDVVVPHKPAATQTIDNKTESTQTEIMSGDFPDPNDVVDAREKQRLAEQELGMLESKLKTAEKRSGELEAESGRLKDAVTEARDKLRKAEQGLQTAEAKNLELGEKNGQLKSDVVAAREKQRLAEQELGTLGSKLKTAEKRSGKLEAESGRLKDAVTEARDKLRKAEQGLQTAEAKNLELGEKNGQLKSDVVDAREKQRLAEQELGTLGSKLKTAEKRSGELEAEIGRLKDAVTEARDKLRKAEQDLQTAEAKNLKLSEENGQLKSDVVDAREKQRLAEQELGTLESKLKTAEKRSGKLEAESGRLKDALTEARDKLRKAEQGLQTAEAKNLELGEKNGQLKSDVVDAREKQRLAEQELGTLESELNRALGGLKAEQEKYGALERKNSELRGKVSDAQEKTRVAEQQLDQATSKLQASDARIEELELERTKQTQAASDARQKLKQVMDKEQLLRGELDGKQRVLNEVERKFRKQSEENVSLKSQLERSAEEKLVIESQRSEASSRADTLENENRGLKEELEKLRALVTSQGDQLTAFTETKNKLELAQDESDRLKSELVTKEKQHASVIDDMKDKLEVERASFDEQITELENKISREINKQVKLGNDLKAAKSELGTQADVRTKVESRLRQVEIAMSGNLNRLERELDRSKKKSGQLESEIHEKDRKINSLSLDYENQSVRAKSLEKEVKRVSSENAGLKNQLKSQKNQVSNAEELTNQKRRQIERERSQHQTELARVKKESLQINDDLYATLDELQRVKGDKRQDGYKFAAKEREYEAKVAELDKKIGVLNKQLKEANTVNTTAHKQVSDIKAQMVELEKERGQHKEDLDQVKSQREQFQNDLDRVKKEKKQQGVEFSLRDKALKEQLAKSESIIEQQQLNVGSLETQINRLNAKILELEKKKQDFGNLSKDSKRIDDNLTKLRQDRDQARLEAKQLKQVMARMSDANSQDVFKYLLREMRAANVEKRQYQAREEHRWTNYSYGVRDNEQFNYDKRLEAQLHDMRMQLQENVERLDEVNGVLAKHGWESKAQNAISERIQKTNDKLNTWDESEPRKVLGERIQKEQNKWDRK